MEEGDPGSDSDFEIDTKKEVSNRKLNSGCLTDTACVHSYINTFLFFISHDFPEEIRQAKSMLAISFNFSFIYYV